MTSGWLKGQLPVGRYDRRRADAGGTFPQQPHMPPGGMSSPQTDDVCSSSEPMSDAPRATSSRSASTSPAQSWLQATATSPPDQEPGQGHGHTSRPCRTVRPQRLLPHLRERRRRFRPQHRTIRRAARREAVNVHHPHAETQGCAIASHGAIGGPHQPPRLHHADPTALVTAEQ